MNNKIKERCKELDMSLSQLAAKTGLILPTLCNVANGKIWAYPKYRRLISEALNCTESELFGKE